MIFLHNLEQEKEIQKIIVDKTPEQLRFRECMWTRNNIRQLIKEKYGIDIKLSTLGYYLARWGFTVQRPVKRAYKQDEKKIDAWLNQEFSGITQRAEEEDALHHQSREDIHSRHIEVALLDDGGRHIALNLSAEVVQGHRVDAAV